MDAQKRMASHRAQLSRSSARPANKIVRPISPEHEFTDEELRAKRYLANSRERQRTEELNDAFKRLRQTIPSMPSDKLSKIHTLRIAANYIRFLDEINESAESTSGNGCGSLKSNRTTLKSNRFLSTAPYAQSVGGEASLNLRATFNRWRERSQQPTASSSAVDQHQRPSSSCDSFTIFMPFEQMTTQSILEPLGTRAKIDPISDFDSSHDALFNDEIYMKYF